MSGTNKTRSTMLGRGNGRARVYFFSGGGEVGIDLGDKYNYANMEPNQARKLAALLVEAAEIAEQQTSEGRK